MPALFILEPPISMGKGCLQCLPPKHRILPVKIPEEVRQAFVRHGRRGGKVRAARMTPEARRAVARQAATSRWINQRFGGASFEALGLPGGDIVDAGLSHLAAGIESPQSLAVSLAAPRLRREGVPVGAALPDADDRLYALLSKTQGDLAHARYLAWLEQMASFADACRYRRLPKSSSR
jgi:hypothetical protein